MKRDHLLHTYFITNFLPVCCSALSSRPSAWAALPHSASKRDTSISCLPAPTYAGTQRSFRTQCSCVSFEVPTAMPVMPRLVVWQKYSDAFEDIRLEVKQSELHSHSSVLKLEPACSCEESVNVDQSIWYHVPENSIQLQSYWACFGLCPSSCMWKTKNPTTFRRLDCRIFCLPHTRR
jgi:hypothetical protein